jgi:hypothetical protein
MSALADNFGRGDLAKLTRDALSDSLKGIATLKGDTFAKVAKAAPLDVAGAMRKAGAVADVGASLEALRVARAAKRDASKPATSDAATPDATSDAAEVDGAATAPHAPAPIVDVAAVAFAQALTGLSPDAIRSALERVPGFVQLIAPIVETIRAEQREQAHAAEQRAYAEQRAADEKQGELIDVATSSTHAQSDADTLSRVLGEQVAQESTAAVEKARKTSRKTSRKSSELLAA